MTITEIIESLQGYQDWRRGADTTMMNPAVIGRVIDAALAELRAVADGEDEV